MKPIPSGVQKLVAEREKLREAKQYKESDEARRRIEALGYEVTDTKEVARVSKKDEYVAPKESLLVLFGSGETAPSAVKTHDFVLNRIGKDKPSIAVISTPAGFQPNVKVVCEEIADFFERHLKNYHPRITIVYADTRKQANNPKLIRPLKEADYMFMGPGSPTYATRHLQHSLLYENIVERVRAGASLGLASAAVMAFSKFTLPVYEIYKAGFPLYWEPGLNLYSLLFRELVAVSHFNNNEGGKKNDTSHAWMGKQRFQKLFAMLPAGMAVWGIDEHTAVLINLQTKHVEVLGKGKLWKLR
jgi:cyanophycinase-like exopeptidase